MNHMIRRIGALAFALATLGAARPAAAQLKVVTSTPDLYDIARQVGGNLVTVTHIGEGYQDPHFIEAKPSFVLQLRSADVWAFVGLDLEIGWMPLLLDGARNPRVRPGGSGYVDVSKAIPVLDVPQGNVDRSMGDVHPLGNPHYWLDPENGRRIARLFKDKFSQLDRKNEDRYEANEKAFEARLSTAEKSWAPYLAQIRGKPVIAYHTSWRYFAEYTGMKIVAYMEPKPGVPPSPSHVYEVIRDAKQAGAKVVIQEPFYDRKMSDLVARNLGGAVLVVPPSVGGTKDVPDYITLMTKDIQAVAAALR
ncbi:MAG: zinc ABC transporter substrate-binding protein [Gemmatimonadaceae bacterium]|nr:zinc ABC transporter substrate-binding protein [Gemmatimonadaceae bacterium]NUR36104.1 zinc ABC transporter substrate-binding protein [Gemmatimonadaceae bacterium]NUS98285.1 zinc ABC transporter substrate-binding protein [Gemmatimonadaceae bacterium]